MDFKILQQEKTKGTLRPATRFECLLTNLAVVGSNPVAVL